MTISPRLVEPRCASRAKWLVVAFLVAVGLAVAPSRAAAWGVPGRRAVVRSGPPDQTWLNDVPERAGAHSKGRVAVFVFKGDDVYEPVRAAVVKTLRRKGLSVTAALRPVDSAAQYRDMSVALNVAVYVDGELSGEGVHQSARIQLRSGVTGQKVASVSFSGPTPKIVDAIERSLWTHVGSTMKRACSSAKRPRRLEREPLRIEAGTPDESQPLASRRT